MTLNGYFTLNFVFALVCLASDCVTFENNCVNIDNDRPMLSAAQMFGMDSIVSGNIRFVRIFVQVLWKEVGSRVNARLELFFFFFRDYSFMHCIVFADIRRVSVQRRQETGQDRTKVTVDD